MYHGQQDYGLPPSPGGRYSFQGPSDMYRYQGQGSRSGTPMSQQGRSRYSLSPAMADDDEYEERDLGTAYQGYGGPPSRSAYSSPPPADPYRANSFEVGTAYHSEPSPYPGTSYYPSDEVPGSYPDFHSEPNEYYWYTGAPPSANSSHTFSGDGMKQYQNDYRSSPPPHHPHHPPSLHPGSPLSEDYPGMFGVTAPHHKPGNKFNRHSMTPPRYNGEHLPNFPSWSRTWYDGHLSANGHAYTTIPPPSGASGWESDSLTRSGGYGHGPHVYGKGGDPHMTDYVKQERMRMLEKEFGKPKVSHGRHRNGHDEDNDEEEERDEGDEDEDADVPLGSVTSRGTLVTERPKWKVAIRWLMGLTALAAFACGIGGALLINPGNVKPAAKGTVASYILYAVSAITLVILLYLYALRPCCCDPMRKVVGPSAAASNNPLAGLVIPVLGGGGGPGQKKPKLKKGKKGRMMMMQQATPTVNLIVDPSLLKGNKREEEDSEEEEEEERLPGDARRKKKRKNGIGVIGNMQLQQRWKLARKSLKLLTIWDSILLLVWVAAEVIALGLGKQCKPGTSNGWCDFYNAAIACGVILVILLLGALYLDWRDLKVSRRAPKPPM